MASRRFFFNEDDFDTCSNYCILRPIDKLMEGIETFVCSSCFKEKHKRCENHTSICNHCQYNDSYETFIERIKTQITDYNSNKVDLIQEEKRQEAMLTKLLQTKASMQGPITKKFEESKKRN